VTQLLALLALTGSAAGAEYILLPPADTAIAGEPISLVLTSCCNISTGSARASWTTTGASHRNCGSG
jgi:hypothetical protein